MHAKQFKAPGSSRAAPASRTRHPLTQCRAEEEGQGKVRQTRLFLGAEAGDADAGTVEVRGFLQATDQPGLGA